MKDKAVEDMAEQIVSHLRDVGCLQHIQGCDDETCSVMLPIKRIIQDAVRGTIEIGALEDELRRIPGGYVYSGACSYQICFPLKSGGELRFCTMDNDCTDDKQFPGTCFGIDLYDGALPPGITGFADKTGAEQSG